MTNHSNCLLHVRTKFHPVKKFRQEVQSLFQSGQTWGGKNPIIHVEERRQLLHHPSKPLWICVLPDHHRFPVADYHVHRNIEYSGRQQVALSELLGALEWGAIVAPYLGYHGESFPISTKEAFRPWPESIGDQYLHTPLPFQGVMHLTQVQEYLIEDLLPHFCQMLYQIIFKGGGLCASSRPEHMYYFILGDVSPYVAGNH